MRVEKGTTRYTRHKSILTDDRILPNSLGADAQKNKAQSMFSATKEQEGPDDPREPFQKLRDSPAPAPTACVFGISS